LQVNSMARARAQGIDSERRLPARAGASAATDGLAPKLA
jgi:hypothetical protein